MKFIAGKEMIWASRVTFFVHIINKQPLLSNPCMSKRNCEEFNYFPISFCWKHLNLIETGLISIVTEQPVEEKSNMIPKLFLYSEIILNIPYWHAICMQSYPKEQKTAVRADWNWDFCLESTLPLHMCVCDMCVVI